MRTMMMEVKTLTNIEQPPFNPAMMRDFLKWVISNREKEGFTSQYTTEELKLILNFFDKLLEVRVS